MKLPLITDEVIDFLSTRFDTPVSINDTNEQIRWKAAQADVVRQIKSVYSMQKSGDKGATQGFNIKMDD